MADPLSHYLCGLTGDVGVIAFVKKLVINQAKVIADIDVLLIILGAEFRVFIYDQKTSIFYSIQFHYYRCATKTRTTQ